MINGHDCDLSSVDRMFAPAEYLADDPGRALMSHRGVDFAASKATLDEADPGSLCIGLIDRYRFSQDCLIGAFQGLHPRLDILPYSAPEDLIAQTTTSLDLVIYYWHAGEGPSASMMRNVMMLRQAFKAIPLVILSDADDAQYASMIRSVLESGARGFIPTRTTGIPITFAAIRFVKAGGTFAPLDLLLTERPERAWQDHAWPDAEWSDRRWQDQVAAIPDTNRQSRLTSRQSTVLFHLQQGKANKIIAHELGMSESTVKVHIRNIMRKTGATNRTQAAYKAQKIWGSAPGENPSG